jgi:hypothetical protein
MTDRMVDGNITATIASVMSFAFDDKWRLERRCIEPKVYNENKDIVSEDEHFL